MQLIKYDTKTFPFKEIIQEWMKVDDLTNLHRHKKYQVFSREKDQSSDWHKIFYEKIKKTQDFLKCYENFLLQVVKPRYGQDIVYQRIPTFRVHLSGNLAVGEFHKDKFYRKKGWSEKVKEKNYYLPFTSTNKHNTIWSESKEDKKDFSPMLLKYGELMEWDGSNLMHGNKINNSSQTRVSVDFRVMRKSQYIKSDYGSINTKVKFEVGGYYEII
mgnify:CR=1 FL=1